MGDLDWVTWASATEIAAAIKAGSVTSVAVTDHFIDRIERLDTEINAVVVRDFDNARAAAAAADAAAARGEDLGPLHGVPMTVKEAYDAAGTPTTWGIPSLAANTATSDSDAVSRFREAGAHLIGKTNVPIYLADFQSYNEIYGTTNNPWNVDKIAGGSSGGSAAALAAGFTPIEAGSDIGGSIRNPAHYCGVFGHKPTWGVVSTRGHALPGDESHPDLAVVGPFARTVDDLELAFDIMAGPEALDAPGWKLDLPPCPHSDLRDFRVAIWPTHDLSPVANEVAARAMDVGARLESIGATVSYDARPDIDFEASFATYMALLNAAMGPELPEGADPTAAPGAPAILHNTWRMYNNQRIALRNAWRSFFEDWDIVVCPIAAVPAFDHDHSPMATRTLLVDGEVRPYFQHLFWAGTITVAGLPSTVFPTGPSDDGLPIGLQAVGAEFGDRTTLQFARLLAAEAGGFVAPPGFA
ncbi:MAG: amidase [Actinomycetota bacterium]